MKRKAIIFPYNAECASLVRNRELLLNHEIVACVSPIGYGLQGKDAAYAYGGKNKGIVISDKKISEIINLFYAVASIATIMSQYSDYHT